MVVGIVNGASLRLSLPMMSFFGALSLDDEQSFESTVLLPFDIETRMSIETISIVEAHNSTRAPSHTTMDFHFDCFNSPLSTTGRKFVRRSNLKKNAETQTTSIATEKCVELFVGHEKEPIGSIGCFFMFAKISYQ